jgi:hypothetical protein
MTTNQTPDLQRELLANVGRRARRQQLVAIAERRVATSYNDGFAR